MRKFDDFLRDRGAALKFCLTCALVYSGAMGAYMGRVMAVIVSFAVFFPLLLAATLAYRRFVLK
ncbi:hypothetical protein UCD39_14770 [Nitrospirillum sp. BR 11752]|uniref:hypothetical protein n=1 Tax=Nitrospirillum sp. BR 11752 TaxID=3104293 RepID=UPI002EBF2EF9|nr:hypothetical protein [Nitrospirillum sp. BR 11752]